MILYHYCSNSAFVSVISNRTIWASELSLTNDVMEGRWIKTIFEECCVEKKVDQFDLKRLLERLDSLIAYFGAAGFCMSEEGDLLSQWRGYADNGAGVSIGFEKEYFDTLNKLRVDEHFGFAVHRIVYDIAEQRKLIETELPNVLEHVKNGALRRPGLLTMETDDEKKRREEASTKIIYEFLRFFPLLFRLKNPAFSEEKEWRLLSYIPRGYEDASGSDNLGMLPELDFRSSTDRVVPYLKLTLQKADLPEIREVVLGPKNLTPILVVKALLKKFGFENVHVRRSSATYR